MPAKAQYVKHSALPGWADGIKGRNDNLLERLNTIKRLIEELEIDWESDSSEEIIRKIQGMDPRFKDYYNVVDNYVKIIRNLQSDVITTESMTKSNAGRFI